MKLVVQIAFGIILAWFTIRAFELLAAATALHAFAQSLTSTEPVPRVRAAPEATQAPQTPQAGPVYIYPQAAADSRHWSVTTVDGRTYSGTGPTPQNGLPPPH